MELNEIIKRLEYRTNSHGKCGPDSLEWQIEQNKLDEECDISTLKYLKIYQELQYHINDEKEKLITLFHNLETELNDYRKLVKEYIDIENQYHEKINNFLQSNAENHILNWEELQQMVGKPLWVTSNIDIARYHGWCICGMVENDCARFIVSNIEDGFWTQELSLWKGNYGVDWKTYRWEKHE